MGLIWSKNPQLAITASEQGQQNGQVDLTAEDEEKSTQKRNVQLELIKFKEELDRKKQERRDALEALNKRMTDLKNEKEKEQEEKEKLLEILELMKLNEDETIKRVERLEEELKLEREEKEKWMNEAKRNKTEEQLEVMKSEEVEGLERHVKALKDVAGISAEMLKIREMQVNELKAKLTAIEETGQAYEKEVDNMRRLRALYDERARAVSISHKMEMDRERARLVASEAKLELAEQRVNTLEEKKAELSETIESMDKSLDEAKADISELKLELAGKRDELYNATSQMAIINQLFSQVLCGPDGLERVTRVLEEHHDLVNHLTAKGKINNLASTLLELADQGHEQTEEEQDIAANLSKVWRLLVELLGHHANKPVVPGDTSPNSCYKSVDTPKGPKLVISVSQTFLRLKDLILEKNSLVKEVGRLKELNSTLETRLVEQESRLAVVADELHETWDIVNRLKTQHKHLHTNEKVLRYELAQKRLLLNELKKELESCKESWELARAKNSQTEEDWRILRKEFASRKQISSAESGYEESPGDSQDEEEWSTRDDNSRDEVETEPDVSREEQDSEEIKDEAVILPVNEIEALAENESTEESKEEKESSNKVDLTSSSTSEEQSVPKQRTAEEILKARESRLKRLEDQCKGLFNRMSQTSQRSDIISSRLVELHEQYGEEGRLKRQRTLSSSEAGTSSTEKTETEQTSSTEDLATSSTETSLLPSHSLETNQIPNPDLDPDPKT